MEQTIQQQYSTPYRPLHPGVEYNLQAGRHLQSNLPLDLTGLDPNEFQQQFQRLQSASANSQQYPDHQQYGIQHGPRQFQQQQPPPQNGPPHTPQHQQASQHQHMDGSPYLMTGLPMQHSAIARVQQQDESFNSPDDAEDNQKSVGHTPTRIEVDPPDLEIWRQKLFDVDEMITLSEEQFQIYFPHIDNVYSHRSTQRYKRKPFVSHYWDCRLKGRPPGTPKSDDPNKKKRKRTARERDLCDVKIKITEYFPGAMLRPDFVSDGPHGPESNGDNSFMEQTSGIGLQQTTFVGVLGNGQPIPSTHPGANGNRYYTIQRVNGNGGNGKGDGVAGPHKHTLADSDKIKKNTVQRHLMKKEKEDKKTQKTYHKRATGEALATVRKRSKNHELKLFGSCFCPFVQRVWIALEAKGIQYQYVEVDPYKKPKELLEVNPRGLVPGIRHGEWGCGESTVLMEYLEDLDIGPKLLPEDKPQLKATCRLWTDHINRKIVPAFYKLLQAQDSPAQISAAKDLQSQIDLLISAAPSPIGPFWLGDSLSFVDIQIAPWLLRFKRVLKPYRSWPDPEPGTRWAKWIDAIEADEAVRSTTSSDELYVESYERYAENRPGTSELADAINGGGGLP